MRVNPLRSGVLLAAVSAMIVVGSVATTVAQEPRQMISVDPHTLKFDRVPGLPSCAVAAPLRGDPSKEASVLLIKSTAGCRVPWHWHTANEDLLIVSGRGQLDMKDGKSLVLEPGAYASLPSHHLHQASFSTNAMFFNSADGPFDIHYVDASGNDISAEQALAKPRTAKRRHK